MKPIIGVMGPGDQATPTEIKIAYALGNAIAQVGWVLLTGGRNVGVMDAACRGARSAHGLTIGILPAQSLTNMSSAVDIPIVTGMGQARNAINVLTSHVIVVCGNGLGTTSEVALAIKAQKPVVFVDASPVVLSFWQNLATVPISIAQTTDQAIAMVKVHLTASGLYPNGKESQA